ncbi:MAG: hypothetical protein WKF67_15240 [Rubrobacteraceae bacterium]
MSTCPEAARPLFLELRALGLDLRVEDDPDGNTLDYRLVVDGLRLLPDARARRLKRRVLLGQEGLVQLLLDRRDPDLYAIRCEGNCR